MYYVWNLFGIIVLQFVSHLLSGFMVGLMVTSSKKAYAIYCVTQVCCMQSPRPCSKPLLTHASAGDTQTLKGRSGSVSVGSLGPGAHRVLFEPSEHLWWVWGLIINAISPLLVSCWGFSFALGCGVSFFGGSNILLLIVVQQWVVILEFSQAKMSASPSTLPSSVSLNTLATWCEELTHWKRPWFWESLKAEGEGDDRG